MKKGTLLIITLLSTIIYSQNTLQSPAAFLGYELGEQFTRHADVVDYFKHVANTSELATYFTYGKTNERRTLSYTIVSSKENLANLTPIQKEHLINAGIESGVASPKTAIVWLSYNVHGNEASSTEAAMNTLYTLITNQQEWLQNTIVIIDPCVNPDGRDRYVNWYNQVKASPYNKHQDATEHHEAWPGGRPNHYLFDLNRDWAWATQVETQQRLTVYNKWLPHIHVDFHEQGINEPYYFAPAAAPFHEVITPWQTKFQTQIGKNHARYFDKEGWLFFTRERFDLLYPSYGDTYPTFMGAIGMTYEQAGHGRAGVGIQTDEGYELTLKDRIAHHTTTGLSTIEISSKNAEKLNTEFKKFFTNTTLKYKSYVLEGNPAKIKSLTTLLDQHDIKYGYTTGKISGYKYQTDAQESTQVTNALVVSTDQPKGKMVKVLFEPNAKLSNPLTYDITAWSMPYAYGLNAIASKNIVSANATNPAKQITNNLLPGAAGYIVQWNTINDAKFLAEVLNQNIKVRFSEKDFINENNDFKKGSLIITKSDNRTNANYDQTLIDIANKHSIQLYPTSTSFASEGIDFGSPDIKLINPQRIGVLKGNMVSSLSYGEIWHFFEKQLKYPITSIDTDYVKNIDLNAYDVIIFPSGYYSKLISDKDFSKELKQWIRKGGKIIALADALSAFAGNDDFQLKKNTSTTEESNEPTNELLIPYDQRERNSVKDFITGSIFKVKVDPSHPMAFGYKDSYYSLKLGNASYQFIEKGYNIAYIEDPICVSGFSGSEALKGLKNSLVFGEAKMNAGSIIYMVDNPLFRSFWENGKLFFVNAIFFTNSNKFRI